MNQEPIQLEHLDRNSISSAFLNCHYKNYEPLWNTTLPTVDQWYLMELATVWTWQLMYNAMVGNYNMEQHGPVTLEGDMARTIAGNTYFVFKLRIIFSVIYTKW